MNSLLRDRLALRQGAAGLVAQLTQAAAGLGIILVVREAGGSSAVDGSSAVGGRGGEPSNTRTGPDAKGSLGDARQGIL